MRRSAFVTIALILLLRISYAQAEAFSFSDDSWEGTTELLRTAQAKLGPNRVILTDGLDWAKVRGTDGILVLHSNQELDFAEASAFLRGGGRLAILEDFGKAWSLLEHFQIRQQEKPGRPAHVLRENPNLAVAVPATTGADGAALARHPIVAQVDQLVTNHPVVLAHPDLTPVLVIPDDQNGESPLAVTGIIVNRGRLFAMGDPSAVINLMLRYPGNRAFAEGLVAYLVEGDDGQSGTGRLFLLSNGFSERGRFGGASTLPQELTDQLKGVRDAVETARREGLPPLAALALAICAAAAVVLWTWNSSTHSYRRPLPRHVAAIPLVAQGGVAGRAAVLAAPTTDATLALMELKSALEEGLAWRLGMPEPTPLPTLLKYLEQRGLMKPEDFQGLAETYRDLERASAAVLAGQSLKESAQLLDRTRDRVERALARLPPSTPPRSQL